MFFASPEGLRRRFRSLGVRLTAGYAVLFLVSVLALFALAYVLLAGSLRQRDRAAIAFELTELLEDYEDGGLGIVQTEALEHERTDGGLRLAIRLAARDGTTLLMPGQAWAGVDTTRLTWGPVAPGTWVLVPSLRDEAPLEIYTHALGDTLLQIGASTAPRAEVLERFRTTFLLILLPVLLLSLLGGALFARRALAPIRALAAAVLAITRTGRFAERVPERGTGDELDALVHLFNEMLDRIQALIRGMRDALDNVAHDLRTPLTRLRSSAERALRTDADPDVLRDGLSDALEESDTVLRVLDTLMDIAEAEAGTIRLVREPLDLAALADDVVDLYAVVAEEKGVGLRWERPEPVPVTADATRLRQALANLVDNAVKYTPSGGTVTVEAGAEDTEAVVRVRDTGIGLEREELPRIWERLYRGDRSRSERGLGLGLSLVKATVEAHGGRVTGDGTGGEGATFTVHLPLGGEGLGPENGHSGG